MPFEFDVEDELEVVRAIQNAATDEEAVKILQIYGAFMMFGGGAYADDDT